MTPSMILHVEQAAVIVESLNAGHSAFRLIAAAAVDVRHRDKFDSPQRQHLPQQIVAAIAYANHADADAVVRAQDGGCWIGQHCCGAECGLLQEISAGRCKFNFVHVSPSHSAL
jgi:hypothetical protein